MAGFRLIGLFIFYCLAFVSSQSLSDTSDVIMDDITVDTSWEPMAFDGLIDRSVNQPGHNKRKPNKHITSSKPHGDAVVTHTTSMSSSKLLLHHTTTASSPRTIDTSKTGKSTGKDEGHLTSTSKSSLKTSHHTTHPGTKASSKTEQTSSEKHSSKQLSSHVSKPTTIKHNTSSTKQIPTRTFSASALHTQTSSIHPESTKHTTTSNHHSSFTTTTSKHSSRAKSADTNELLVTTTCTPYTVCVDAINSCGIRYGDCYDTCTASGPSPPPCPKTTTTAKVDSVHTTTRRRDIQLAKEFSA